MSILHPEVYSEREIGWSVAAPLDEHEPRSDAERMPPDHLLPDYIGRRVLNSFINFNGVISHHKNSYDWFINMNVPHIVREYQEIRIFDQKAQRLTILLMKNPRVEKPKMLTPEGQACPVDVETAAACKASYSCSIVVDIVELQYKVRDGEHVCANPSGKPTITSSGKVLRIFTSLNGASGLDRPASLNEQSSVEDMVSFPPTHPETLAVPLGEAGGEGGARIAEDEQLEEEDDEGDPDAMKSSDCYGMIFMTRPRKQNTFGDEEWLENEKAENVKRRQAMAAAGNPLPEIPPGTYLQKPSISQYSSSAELDEAPVRVDPRFVLVERVFYQNVEMCKVAAMVGSSVCYTSDEPPGPAAPLNRLGGFMVQNGAAKVMVPTLTLRPNRFFVFSEGPVGHGGDRVSFHGEIRAEDGSKIRSTRTLQLFVETGPGGSGITVARIKTNMLREPIPVWAWLRVLGYRTIPEAARAIAWGGRLADDDLERHPLRRETLKFEMWIAGVLGYRDSSKSSGRGRAKALGQAKPPPPAAAAAASIGAGAGVGPGAGGGGGAPPRSSEEGSKGPVTAQGDSKVPDFSSMSWSEVNSWVSSFVANDKPNLRHLIMSEFEPQNGFTFDGRSLRVKRRAMAFYLCRIFRVCRGEEPHDNRDACFSLETPGKRLTHQLRLAHRPRMRALLSGVARMKESNRHVDAPTKFYSAQTTHHMGYAIRTGKWGQGKGGSSITGITHAVKRVNRVEIVSQMTAVQKNPESKKTKNIDPRLLPTEFWGLMCPSGTPEGESCGLTLYLSQGARVVMGVPFEDIYRIIYAYLVQEGHVRLVHVGEEPPSWNPNFETTCALFIQGTLVGLVEDGARVSRMIRALRRKGLMPADVAVSHNVDRSEVFVSCEHGTLRRPLFVLEPEGGFPPESTAQERMQFRRVRVAEIRAVVDRYARDVSGDLFRDLMSRGLVEFIDKDEENNLRISADASRDPEDEEIRYYDFWSKEEEMCMAPIVPSPKLERDPNPAASASSKGDHRREEVEDEDRDRDRDQESLLESLRAIHKRMRTEDGEASGATTLREEVARIQALLSPISDSRAEELVRESRRLEASILALKGGAPLSSSSSSAVEGGGLADVAAAAADEETAMGQGVAGTAREDEAMRNVESMQDRLDRVMAELRCPVVFASRSPEEEMGLVEEVRRDIYSHSLLNRPEFVLDPELHLAIQREGVPAVARRAAFPTGSVSRPFHDDVVDRVLQERDPEAHERYYRALRTTWMVGFKPESDAELLYAGVCGGVLPPELRSANMREVGAAALAAARTLASSFRRSSRPGVASSLDGLLDREVAQAVRLRARLDPDRARRIQLFWASSFRRAREARRRAMLQHRAIPEDLIPARGPHRGLTRGDVTHAELHPTAMFGFVLSQSPFPDRNQGPRNTYTQAMRNSSYTGATEEASETQPGARLLSGEFPAVQSLGGRQNQDSAIPHGAMAWCAFICTDGLNQEDSLIMSKGFVDSGKLRVLISTVTRDTATNGIKSDEQHFEKPDVTNTLGVRTGRLDKLEPGGYPAPGSMLLGGDYIIGKTTVARTRTGERTKMDTGTIVRVGDAPQVVESVLVSQGHDGYSHMSVRTRHLAIPQVGDKFATRNGQKGALSSIEQDENMPYMVRMVPIRRRGPDGQMKVVGHKPQMVRMEFLMNTHAMPSRMTGSQMLEMYLSSLAAMNGIVVDATAFQFGATMTVFKKHLQEAGWDMDGRATLYSGITGEPLEGRVFCGPVDLMVLKQKVLDKFNVRARGPVTAITRQPVPGRQKLGALKLGEMERDNMLAHGASKFIEERFVISSNPYETTVCRACGFIALPGQGRSEDAERLGVTVGSTDPFCRNCKSSKHVVSIRTTYSSKQFIQTMMAMGIAPRLQIATSREVDFESQVAPGALPLCRNLSSHVIKLPTAEPPSHPRLWNRKQDEAVSAMMDDEACDSRTSARKRGRQPSPPKTQDVVVHEIIRDMDASIADLF